MKVLQDICRIDRVMNSVAAGTSNQTSSAVDMAADVGYDECTFVALFGALTATQVTGIKVQQSSDDGSSDAYADLAGSASALLADGNGNCMLVTTVRPQKRYLKCIVLRGTANAAIDGVVAILSKAHDTPVAQSTKVIGWKNLDFPAAGTA